jgi:hypothetical protein
MADNPEHGIGFLNQIPGPADYSEPVGHRNALGAGKEWELHHLPIQPGGGDGFLGGGRFIELDAETMPGNFVDVKHRSLTILQE